MRGQPTPGTRVRLTDAFLRNTGQVVGGEAFARWTVVSCPCGLCQTGRFVAVDQPSTDDPDRSRHVAVANLEVIKPRPQYNPFPKSAMRKFHNRHED